MDLMTVPLARYEAERSPRSEEPLPHWLPKPNPTYALPVSDALELALRTGSDYYTSWETACTLSELPMPLRTHVQLNYSHMRRMLVVTERHYTGDWVAKATYRTKA